MVHAPLLPSGALPERPESSLHTQFHRSSNSSMIRRLGVQRTLEGNKWVSVKPLGTLPVEQAVCSRTGD